MYHYLIYCPIKYVDCATDGCRYCTEIAFISQAHVYREIQEEASSTAAAPLRLHATLLQAPNNISGKGGASKRTRLQVERQTGEDVGGVLHYGDLVQLWRGTEDTRTFRSIIREESGIGALTGFTADDIFWLFRTFCFRRACYRLLLF